MRVEKEPFYFNGRGFWKKKVGESRFCRSMEKTRGRRSTYQFLFKPYAIKYIEQNKSQWNLGGLITGGNQGRRAPNTSHLNKHKS